MYFNIDMSQICFKILSLFNETDLMANTQYRILYTYTDQDLYGST